MKPAFHCTPRPRSRVRSHAELRAVSRLQVTGEDRFNDSAHLTTIARLYAKASFSPSVAIRILKVDRLGENFDTMQYSNRSQGQKEGRSQNEDNGAYLCNSKVGNPFAIYVEPPDRPTRCACLGVFRL